MKQAMKSQMKDVPEAQRDMILDMVEKNPEIFEKIAKEVEEEVKKGMEKNTAAILVMNRHRADLQKIAQK